MKHALRSLTTALMSASLAGMAQADLATDTGSDPAYSGGWTNGSNGGSGFGAWVVTSSGGTSGFAGAFIGDPAAGGIGGMSSNAFGFFANSDAAAFAQADRDFSAPMSVGEVFSLDWGINFDSGAGGGNKGFSIFSGGTTGTELINVNNGGSAAITLGGTDVGFSYGTNVMTWSFTYTDPTTVSVSANGRNGSESFSTNITVGAAPDSFRLYASNLQSGDAAQPYYDNLEIGVVPEPSTMMLLGFGALSLAGLRRKIRG